MLPNYFRVVASCWLFLSSLLLGLWSYTLWGKQKIVQHTMAQQEIAKQFLVSDFCLSTESRHVRHLSMPEWIAPFQDFPAYHEHFPSSSFFQVDKKALSNAKKR